MNVEEIKRQIDSKKTLIKKLEKEIQELEKNIYGLFQRSR